jgi:tRNA(fMet)-specific endonuclease VapC
LPFDTRADPTYGLLRARFEQSGKPIGANDLLIAAQALSLGHVLVTDNELEFSRVDGFSCENWLR